MLNLKLATLLIVSVSSLIASLSIAYYYGFALPKKDQAVLALQVAKLRVTPTPTLTPTTSTTTPSPEPTKRLLLNTLKVVDQPTPTTEIKEMQQQSNDFTSQYNDAVKQPQLCQSETDKVNKQFDLQIQALNNNIDDLRKQEKEACPYDNPFAEACLVGRIATEIKLLEGQISGLVSQEGQIEADRTKELNLITTYYCNK